MAYYEFSIEKYTNSKYKKPFFRVLKRAVDRKPRTLSHPIYGKKLAASEAAIFLEEEITKCEAKGHTCHIKFDDTKLI